MREKLALVASIVLGLITVIAMKTYIDRQKEEGKPKVDMIKVIAAKKLLEKGAMVTEKDLEPLDLPAKSVSADMVQAEGVNLIMGKTLQRTINRGGIIFDSDFTRAEIKTSSVIPKGKRLITISVDNITGVSGLVNPGSMVDIIWSRAIKKGGGSAYDQRSIILFSKVSVYSVDHRTSAVVNLGKRQENYTSVTLYVTPEEAPIITTAQETGKLTLVLRPGEDTDVLASVPPIQIDDVEKAAQAANEARNKK